MGAFRDAMYNTANRLLSVYGQSISVSRNNTSAFNPTTGVVANTTYTEYEGYGYPSQYKASQIDGSIIQQGDILLIFSCATAPLVNDVFTVGSKDYTALDIQNITAQGSNVIYKVQLRQ